MNRKLTHWGLQRLKPTLRIILIKVVLSTLPIYQCSSLLAPKFISNQIVKKIRSFLWKGGKSTQTKFHLVNWNQVTSDKNHGGLGIREPTLMNIAMGDKLLWRLIIGNLTWWKKAIWKKYFTRNRLRCVDLHPKVDIGSPIFKFILATRILICAKLNWIPRNG
jgi:hypothetical protein